MEALHTEPAEVARMRTRQLDNVVGILVVGDTMESDKESAWQKRSLCAQTDPEAFFPEKGISNKDAKRVCVSCVVKAECLNYALDNNESFGIWGGLTERERRQLKRQAV